MEGCWVERRLGQDQNISLEPIPEMICTASSDPARLFCCSRSAECGSLLKRHGSAISSWDCPKRLPKTPDRRDHRKHNKVARVTLTHCLHVDVIVTYASRPREE